MNRIAAIDAALDCLARLGHLDAQAWANLTERDQKGMFGMYWKLRPLRPSEIALNAPGMA